MKEEGVVRHGVNGSRSLAQRFSQLSPAIRTMSCLMMIEGEVWIIERIYAVQQMTQSIEQ